MNTKTAGIFIGLTVAGVVVIALGQFISINYVQNVLVGIGSALFCSGLTFFLVKFEFSQGK